MSGGLLVIKSGPQSSLPLLLPAHTVPGPKEVRAQSGHYEIKLMTQSSRSPSPDSDNNAPLLDATQLATINPVSFLCASCSLPVIQSNHIETWRDLPSEHWEELVEAWMCHGDQKLHDHVQQHSKAGFWPAEGLALVGGSYILFDETAMNTNNLHVAPDSRVRFSLALTSIFPPSSFICRAQRRLALAFPSGCCWGISRPSARSVGALGFAASSALTVRVLSGQECPIQLYQLIQNVLDRGFLSQLLFQTTLMRIEVYFLGATLEGTFIFLCRFYFSLLFRFCCCLIHSCC